MEETRMTQLEKKHQGLGMHRLKSNALEAQFALAWQGQSNPAGLTGPDTIDYLLHTGDQTNPKRCSERDRIVANTVIQWLGSPVGQSFVRGVLDNETEGCDIEVEGS